MVASDKDLIAEAHADGLAAGASAERARIAAILDHADAKGREQLARHFAFKTAMAPADAAAALAAAGLEAAPAPLFLSTPEPPKGRVIAFPRSMPFFNPPV
jgi:hypothetical protein